MHYEKRFLSPNNFGWNRVARVFTHSVSSVPQSEELGEDDDDDTAKNDEAREAFINLAGADGEMDAYELKDILNSLFMSVFEFDGFSSDMTRGMVAIFDVSFILWVLWQRSFLCVKGAASLV